MVSLRGAALAARRRATSRTAAADGFELLLADLLATIIERGVGGGGGVGELVEALFSRASFNAGAPIALIRFALAFSQPKTERTLADGFYETASSIALCSRVRSRRC